MKYALIGCGRIATNHIRAAINNRLSIVAVCDIVFEHACSLLKNYALDINKAIQYYDDYKKMLEVEKPDVVAIATVSGIHAKIALECIQRGIHVIIEKPLAMSIEDANKIIRLSEEKRVVVAVCHQNRFNIAVQEVHNALLEGRFGKLSHGSVHVRWNRNQDYYNQAKWRGTWEQDGGCLMNQCIHGIDLLRWLMGRDVVEVYGQTRKRFHHYLETEDVGISVIQFRDGTVATLEGTTNVFPNNLEETLYLFGEKGTVKLGGKSCNTIDIWNFSDEKAEDKMKEGFYETTPNVYGNGHISLYADMIDAINKQRKPYVDAYAGKEALEIVLAVYKSQLTGMPVKLPLEEFSSSDMKGSMD